MTTLSRNVLRPLTMVMIVFLGIASASRIAEAQPVEPVVFVHGLGQGGGNWHALAGDLVLKHPISALTPSLGSFDFFYNQASVLGSSIGGYNDIAAISHSNGGVVVREYARTWPSRINRHLSLGTPHLGAPLAARVLDGTALSWGGYVAGQVFGTFGYYATHDPDWFQLADPYTLSVASWLAWLFDIPIWPEGLAALGLIITQLWTPPDVLPSMPPGSGFMNTLNSGPSLSNEAQKIPVARVSISSEYPQELMPWRIFTGADVAPDLLAAYWAEQTLDLAMFAYNAYWYYLYHEDYQLRNEADMWWDLWLTLSTIPFDWAALVGGVGASSDGIVPLWSSEYPGGTHPPRVLDQYTLMVYHEAQLDPVPNHDQDAFRQLVNAAIVQDLGIVPPTPLTASMTGPSAITTSGNYSWSVGASGGEGNYEYTWYRRTDYYWPRGHEDTCHFQTPWSVVGTGPTYSSSVSVSDLDFDLRVEVQSGQQAVTKWLDVEVGDGSQLCPS